MAELDGAVGGGGADAGAGAGDHEDWLVWPCGVRLFTLPARGVRRPNRGPLPGRAGAGRPLRELLPEAVPSVRAARGLDPVHGAQAAGRRPDRFALVHAVRRPSGPRAAKLTRAGAGDRWRRLAESGGGADRRRTARAGRSATTSGGSWRSRRPRSRCSTCRAAWMYRARLPRTKLLSPAPAARFSGRLTVDGRSIDVDGWRGMAGHNWGAQHAERWIWLHGLTEDGDWLDAAIGRMKLGPVTTPWVANGALSVAGDRHAAASGEGHRVPGPLHVRAVGRRRGGARHGRGAARALRRLGVRGPGRLRAPRRELLDRGHAADA